MLFLRHAAVMVCKAFQTIFLDSLQSDLAGAQHDSRGAITDLPLVKRMCLMAVTRAPATQ